jgi:hypothetical protein
MLESIDIRAGDLVWIQMQAFPKAMDSTSRAVFLVLDKPYLTVINGHERYVCDLAGSRGEVKGVPVDWIYPALAR